MNWTDLWNQILNGPRWCEKCNSMMKFESRKTVKSRLFGVVTVSKWSCKCGKDKV